MTAGLRRYYDRNLEPGRRGVWQEPLGTHPLMTKALLATFGSFGDVYPLIGLGCALQRHGLDVTVITNGYFATTVAEAGLGFIEIGTAEQYELLTADKDLWHPRRGFELVTQAWIALMPETYAVIEDHYVPGRTVVVATAPVFGARVAQEHLGVPLATVQLQPATFRSLHETPRLPVVPPPEWQPRFFKRFVYWLADQLVDRVIAAPLNAFRSQFDLPPVRRVLGDWWLSPQLVIGLFPDWFAPPQPDWPPQSLLSGFPLYDGARTTALSAQAMDFLRAGSPPIVFTPGSAMRHGKSFFQTAVDACQLLGRRGILLTRYPEQLPASLPESVRDFEFLPMSGLLPHCAAIVHHGGIGTTAQGFAAGIPQLIMPMAFDQPDNAARAVRLGVARAISPRAFRPAAVARLLAELLERPESMENCRRGAQRTADPRRLDAACEAICRLVAP
jgi:rhamnosyltransferase subunit B